MDILGFLMLTVFGAVVFFTLMVKLLTPKAPPPEEESEAPRRTEPTPTDVDRFLAEVNRRRREAERQQPQPSRPEPRRDQDRERQREQRQRERERRSEGRATVRRVSEEQASRLPMVQPVEVVEAVVEPIPDSVWRLPTGNEGRGAGRISPVLTAALPLLRSPRALGTAIVLQEIFGPPLCRRRSR